MLFQLSMLSLPYYHYIKWNEITVFKFAFYPLHLQILIGKYDFAKNLLCQNQNLICYGGAGKEIIDILNN
jgi:hypothetical protein